MLTKELSDLLQHARQQVSCFTKDRVTVVDPAQFSLGSKLPYKAICLREGLLWRTEEVARSACDLFERNGVASAITLARATAENAAAMSYLLQLVNSHAASDNVEEFDNKLMQLLLGSRSEADMPQAVNVLTMLRKANNVVPGIEKNYALLSEFAHPNWSGVLSLFSENDLARVLTRFGNELRSNAAVELGLKSLVASLALVEFSYNRLSDALPGFISACEQNDQISSVTK